MVERFVRSGPEPSQDLLGGWTGEFELGTVTAEQGASVEYTEEVTSEASRGEVRESGASPTVFAALTREVEPRYVHADDVDEVCERTADDDGVGGDRGERLADDRDIHERPRSASARARRIMSSKPSVVSSRSTASTSTHCASSASLAAHSVPDSTNAT